MACDGNLNGEHEKEAKSVPRVAGGESRKYTG